MTVEVYSGAERVRLYLNDKLVGEKPSGRDQQFKAEFEVPYAPGTLKVEGLRGDRVVAQSTLQSAGVPIQLKLSADRTVLNADEQDLSFVTVEAVDEEGRLQMNANQKVRILVSGAGTIAAVGNGDGQSQEPYSGNTFSLFHGRALVVLRTSRQAGPIKLTASGDSLPATFIVVESRNSESRAELR
jgi:beta-galactosidase